LGLDDRRRAQRAALRALSVDLSRHRPDAHRARRLSVLRGPCRGARKTQGAGMSKTFARLSGLTVVYDADGQTGAALEAVDLEIVPGERLAIIGESGSGKSTLALTLTGLLPDNARVTGHIAWPAYGEAPLAGRDYGFVFQDAGA